MVACAAALCLPAYVLLEPHLSQATQGLVVNPWHGPGRVTLPAPKGLREPDRDPSSSVEMASSRVEATRPDGTRERLRSVRSAPAGMPSKDHSGPGFTSVSSRTPWRLNPSPDRHSGTLEELELDFYETEAALSDFSRGGFRVLGNPFQAALARQRNGVEESEGGSGNTDPAPTAPSQDAGSNSGDPAAPVDETQGSDPAAPAEEVEQEPEPAEPEPAKEPEPDPEPEPSQPEPATEEPAHEDPEPIGEKPNGVEPKRSPFDAIQIGFDHLGPVAQRVILLDNGFENELGQLFPYSQQLGFFLPLHHDFSVLTGDVTADGLADAILVETIANPILRVFAGVPGSSPAPFELAAEANLGAVVVNSMALFDFDGDQRPEIALAVAGNPNLVVYELKDGLLNFWGQVSFPIPAGFVLDAQWVTTGRIVRTLYVFDPAMQRHVSIDSLSLAVSDVAPPPIETMVVNWDGEGSARPDREVYVVNGDHRTRVILFEKRQGGFFLMANLDISSSIPQAILGGFSRDGNWQGFLWP